MSSWVQLLLAVLAACLRFGAAEGDALPAALVELVRNSPIASIEDLQLLLLTDSVDEEDGTSAANGGHRLPRSLDVQPAQQALCKVRTEVVEVTRAMLDRSNANFLLWPPCIEVQRCSGCCNTKSLQCVPFVTHTKHLQVMRIEYINKRPSYSKAEVSVVDHVECRCQPAPRPSAPRKKSSRRQHNHPHRNQTLSQGHSHGQVKGHSKDELHQWDELKHNQGVHLEDLLEQHWNPRGDTFTQPEEGYSLAGDGASRSGDAVLFGPHWSRNATGLAATHVEAEKRDDVERKGGGAPDENKTFSSPDNVGAEDENRLVEEGAGSLRNNSAGGGKGRSEDAQTRSPLWHEDKAKITKSHTGRFSPHVTSNPSTALRPTLAPVTDRVGTRPRPTKEPNPDPRGPARRRENETPEERILQMEEARLEEEKKELLLLHKRLDQEKEILKQQQMKREEEERQREAGGQHHPHGKHHHHLQTTTQKPETTTSTSTTRKPQPPAAPKHAARPKQPRKRMRKNRRRISKAAMRAMLM